MADRFDLINFSKSVTTTLGGTAANVNIDVNTLFVDGTNNRVGIGTDVPSSTLSVYNPTSTIVRVDGEGQTAVQIRRYSNDVSGPVNNLLKFRGTSAVPAAVQTGDVAGTYSWVAFGGTNQRTLGGIAGAVENYVSDSNISGAILFSTANAGTVLEQARLTGAGNFQFNSGYGSVATAFGCRAWVCFNGSGTVTIRASGNVTSITDNGVGDYTINFTNAMPDANYSTVGSARSSGVGNGTALGTITSLAGTVRVGTSSGAINSAVDPAEIGIAIFR